MFLFFKNAVKILKFRLTFYHFRKSYQGITIKTTAFMLKFNGLELLEGPNNYQQEKNTPIR